MDAIFRHFQRYLGIVIVINVVAVVGIVVGIIGLVVGSWPAIIIGAALFLAPCFFIAVMAWRALHSQMARGLFDNEDHRGYTPADLVQRVSPLGRSNLAGFTPERPVTDQLPEERQRG